MTPTERIDIAVGAAALGVVLILVGFARIVVPIVRDWKVARQRVGRQVQNTDDLLDVAYAVAVVKVGE